MDSKQQRVIAKALLKYIEQLKEDPNLIPPDGTLETKIEIAISKSLDSAYKHGLHNAIHAMHVSLTRLQR